MKKSLAAIVCGMTVAGLAGLASANYMDVYFEEWELGGAFDYTHSLNNYEFGTTATVRAGSWNEITISSGEGSDGWDYEIVIDYSNYCLACLNPAGSAYVTISNLSDELEVASATANFGTFSHSANGFSWDASATSIGFNGSKLIISFNSAYVPPVPAPGALALLGVAGMVGRGRRRR